MTASSRSESARSGSPTLSTDKQLEYARDAITHVITLCSGILAVSLTFAQQFAAGASSDEKHVLQLAWVALLVALIAGVWSLLSIAGIAFLGRGDLRSPGLRLPWLLQLLAFIVGIGSLVWFGLLVL